MVLSLVLLAVFSAVRHFGFVLLDDALHVSENPLFHPLNLESFRRLWSGPFQGLYIPVTYSLWGFEAELSRFIFSSATLAPKIFHLGNLLFHFLNSALLYAVLLRCFQKVIPALIGTLFFALHPVQVESVAWVSGFKDLSCGFFSISAIFFYLDSVAFRDRIYPEALAEGSRRNVLWLCAEILHFVQDKFRHVSSKRERIYLDSQNDRKKYVLSLVSMLFALLSKPAAVVLPLFFLILELGYIKTPLKQALKRTVPAFFIVLPILCLTRLSQPEKAMSYVSPWKDRIFVLADAIIFYVSKLLIPLGLSADYSRTPQFVMNHASGKIAVLGLVALFILMWRRHRILKLSLALFIAALIPVLGLIPFYYQFFSTVADRYLYLALIGPAFGIAWWLSLEFNFRKFVFLCLLLLIYGFLSHQQVRVWQNDETLFSNVLRTNPKSLMAHNNLGAILEKQDRFEEAALHYGEAIQIYPDSLPARYNLGRVLARLGHFELSIKVIETLLKMEPNIADAYYTLAMSYRALGDFKTALKNFDQSLKLNPGLARSYFQRGLTLYTLKRTQEAQNDYKMALEIEPNFTQAQKALDESRLSMNYNTK